MSVLKTFDRVNLLSKKRGIVNMKEIVDKYVRKFIWKIWNDRNDMTRQVFDEFS